jgi:hypothetical protein
MYAEPSSVPIGGAIQPLDAPVDASPSAFINPGIPRPPKQSNAELEMAISGILRFFERKFINLFDPVLN